MSFLINLATNKVAGMRRPEGLAYNRSAISLLTNVMVVVAAHIPCRGPGEEEELLAIGAGPCQRIAGKGCPLPMSLPHG